MSEHKVAYTAQKIAERLKARAGSNAPLQMFYDEAYRIVMEGKEMDYLTKREFNECRSITSIEAEARINERI